MSITFYNTSTRNMDEFQPLEKGVVRLYTCGPTVYNYPHIGNLRTFLFEDLLHRWLAYRGFEVRHVMNLTDVDDKTIRDSQKKNMSLQDYTAIYKKAFFEDLNALNVKPATHYPAATDFIPDMIALITTLMNKGHAYESEDGVYFRVDSYEGYGKLAHLDHANLKTGASGRVTKDEYDRESISDFALWKKWTKEDGDVKWDSPWGAGRPGWHIECSVMSMKYLGPTMDIHAGGVDLIFPHHENEIAQSEAATGQEFSRFWLHAAHLVVDGQKMSKSKGNFYTLRDLQEKGFDPRVLRYALFSTHYRKPYNFTLDGMRAAESTLHRLDDFIISLQSIQTGGGDNPEHQSRLEDTRSRFELAMDEDLNIAEAMGVLFEMVKYFNENISALSPVMAGRILGYLKELNVVLGFLHFKDEEGLSDEEQSLLDQRAQARLAKDYIKSDEIRDLLLERGIEVRDTPQGQVWKRI